MSPEIVGRLRPPRLASAPATPAVGELYADTVANQPYYYNGTAWVAWLPPTVTSLPSSPVDGQECHYVADAANGVVWHLKYRAADPSAYKWQYVGGPALINQVDTSESTASGTYVDLTTVGPQVTLPLGGDFALSFGVNIANGWGLYAPKFGAATTVDSDCLNMNGTSNNISVTRTMRRNSLTAATLIKLQQRTAGTSVSFSNRWLSITPIRVG